MKRWLGWTIVLGLGGALAAGCVSRQEEDAQQVSKPYEPIQQKYKSPSASEAQSGPVGGSGQGGAGDQGVAMPEPWREHPAQGDDEIPNDRGPFVMDGQQTVPRERRDAPLGVGGGPDTARKMAGDQLETQ
ncbi:hypothetical protein [Archangium sp.]|uniref:hypothetical protein n=1 Tax=Archangium sp. TaxID=1872627 RepID=UPI002D4A90DB|nr:hypothetical protein [Archangium sp.]HYO54757.1 hypothetical protein [Archangium sp.]